jgi:hypothetical protein
MSRPASAHWMGNHQGTLAANVALSIYSQLYCADEMLKGRLVNNNNLSVQIWRHFNRISADNLYQYFWCQMIPDRMSYSTKCQTKLQTFLKVNTQLFAYLADDFFNSSRNHVFRVNKQPNDPHRLHCSTQFYRTKHKLSDVKNIQQYL